MLSEPLNREEMVSILEQIARGGRDTARIQAIKTLIVLGEREEGEPPAGFDALDELAPKRAKRAS